MKVMEFIYASLKVSMKIFRDKLSGFIAVIHVLEIPNGLLISGGIFFVCFFKVKTF